MALLLFPDESARFMAPRVLLLDDRAHLQWMLPGRREDSR